MKWMLTVLAVMIACAGATLLRTSGVAEAQQPDPLIDPPEGAAGSRFQIVGQVAWTPGDTVTISYGFSDAEPGATYDGPFYNQQQVTVLRDGTWSFPTVVNDRLFPFPLWRPGFIVVKAKSATTTAINSYVYTVDGRAPRGLPPLASLGSGPGEGDGAALALTFVLFAAATGALLALGGVVRLTQPVTASG